MISTVVMFQAKKIEKLQIVLEKLLCPPRSLWRRAWLDCASQHNTKPARPRPRPIFWSQTGLVLRPTVSDHITSNSSSFDIDSEFRGSRRIRFWIVKSWLGVETDALDRKKEIISFALYNTRSLTLTWRNDDVMVMLMIKCVAIIIAAAAAAANDAAAAVLLLVAWCRLGGCAGSRACYVRRLISWLARRALWCRSLGRTEFGRGLSVGGGEGVDGCCLQP